MLGLIVEFSIRLVFQRLVKSKVGHFCTVKLHLAVHRAVPPNFPLYLNINKSQKPFHNSHVSFRQRTICPRVYLTYKLDFYLLISSFTITQTLLVFHHLFSSSHHQTKSLYDVRHQAKDPTRGLLRVHLILPPASNQGVCRGSGQGAHGRRLQERCDPPARERTSAGHCALLSRGAEEDSRDCGGGEEVIMRMQRYGVFEGNES